MATKTKKSKKKVKAVPQIIFKIYPDFNTLAAQLNAVPFSKVRHVTFLIDKLLMNPVTYEVLVKKATAFNKKAGTKDLMTVNRVKSHINFRKRNNNFVYTVSKNAKGVETIACTDVK